MTLAKWLRPLPGIFTRDSRRFQSWAGGSSWTTLPEEKLNLDQLDDATRLKIGRRVGAQALITGMIYSPGILNWYLQVKIIDTETGQVLGRSMVEIDSLFATDIEKAARLAVEKLSLW